jgi:hypothetical protein
MYILLVLPRDELTDVCSLHGRSEFHLVPGKYVPYSGKPNHGCMTITFGVREVPCDKRRLSTICLGSWYVQFV